MKNNGISKKELKDMPLRVKAEIALQEAIAEAIAEHKRRGHPIAVWRNNKVVLIPPDEIIIPDVTPPQKPRLKNI